MYGGYHGFELSGNPNPNHYQWSGEGLPLSEMLGVPQFGMEGIDLGEGKVGGINWNNATSPWGPWGGAKGGYVPRYQEGGFVENEYPGTYPIYPEGEEGGELGAGGINPYEESPWQPDYDPGFQKTANTLEVPWSPWEGLPEQGPSEIPNYDWNNDGTINVLDAVGGQQAGWSQNMLQGLTNQIIPPGGQGIYPSPPTGSVGFSGYDPKRYPTPVTGEGDYLNPPAAQTAMNWTPGEGPTGYQEIDPYAPGGGGVNPIIPEEEFPVLDPVYSGKSWGGAGGGYVPLNGFFKR